MLSTQTKAEGLNAWFKGFKITMVQDKPVQMVAGSHGWQAHINSFQTWMPGSKTWKTVSFDNLPYNAMKSPKAAIDWLFENVIAYKVMRDNDDPYSDPWGWDESLKCFNRITIDNPLHPKHDPAHDYREDRGRGSGSKFQIQHGPSQDMNYEAEYAILSQKDKVAKGMQPDVVVAKKSAYKKKPPPGPFKSTNALIFNPWPTT